MWLVARPDHDGVLLHDSDGDDLGLMTTYPANWLLVRWGVKGAM